MEVDHRVGRANTQVISRQAADAKPATLHPEDILGQRRVEAQLIGQLYKQAPIATVGNLINASILVFLLWKLVSHHVLLIWWGAVVTLAGFRYGLLRAYRQAASKTLAPELWGSLQVAGVGASGMFWGAAGIFLFPEGSTAHQTFIAFVLAGMVAGAVGTCSSVFPAFVAFALPALMPIFVRFLLVGDELHRAMAAMTLLFLVLTGLTARHLNHSARELVGLKEHFVDKVAARTAELTRANEVLNREIAERKHAEESLRASQERLRLITDSVPGVVTYQNVTRPDGTVSYTYLSAGVEPLFGLTAESVLADAGALRQLVLEEDRPRIAATEQEALRNRAPFDCEFRWRTVAGEIKWVHCRSTALRLAEGSVLWNGVLSDTTARKKAEAEAAAQQQRLTMAQEAAGMVLWEWDIPAGSIRYSNNLNAIVRGEAVAPYCSVDGLMPELHPEDRERLARALEGTAKEGRPFECEYRVRMLDGTYRWILGKGKIVAVEEGKPIRVLGLSMDITERKEAQQRTEAALAEKEVLLKEIHHRVKNNLAVIVSLLRMQSSRIVDPRAKEALQDCHDRVQAMALVHETLYQSEDLAAIPLATYARTLSDDLLQVMLAGQGETGIQVVIEAEGVRLPIDQAMPCGLILNELLTNAVKYAFPDHKGGDIHISARLNETGFELEVRDNGVGLPLDLDPEHCATLGFRIISTLVKHQMEGHWEAWSANGACFRIRWPIRVKTANHYEQRAQDIGGGGRRAVGGEPG